MIVKMDKQGRVCIPAQYRKEIGIYNDEHVRISVEFINNEIIISDLSDSELKSYMTKLKKQKRNNN